MRCVVTLIWLLALATPTTAEESPIPRLGDHTFVPVMAITEPFLTTHIQTSVSLATTVNSTTPIYSLIDSTVVGTTDNEQFLTSVGFEYQHAVKEWLAVGVSIGAAGRLGTETNTLLSDGITGALGYNFSWKLRLHRSRSVFVSGSVGMGNRNATFINLLDWAEGLLVGTNVPLVRTRNSLRGGGGVHAGWGLNRRFGLLGSAYVDYGESFDGRGENSWFTDVRLAMSYDAAQDIKAPLGLAITGGHYENHESADADRGVWFWSTRIAVQSRSDFSIGLDLEHSYYDSKNQDHDLQISQITIDMRYFY